MSIDNSELIEAAQQLRQDGDLMGAASLTRDALKDDPDNWEYLHILGLILNEAGLADQALPILQRCIAIRGADSALLFNYGVVLREMSQFHQAARAFRHAAEASPERFDCWYNLGEALHGLSWWDEAVEALSRAAEIEPDSSDTWFLLGNVRVAQKEFKAAIEIFEKALAQAPENPKTLNNLGLALKGAERLPEATAVFERAIELDPTVPSPYDNLANVRVLMGDVAGAIESFQQALRLKPDYADARFNLAEVYFEQRNYCAAEAEYRVVLKTTPDHRLALMSLAHCLQLQGDPEAAKRQLDIALGLWPEDTVILAQMGNLLRDIGDFKECQRCFERALELEPVNWKVIGNLALACQHQGKTAEAVDYYRRALFHHGDEHVHSNFAQALLLTENYEEGWSEFEHRLSNPATAKIMEVLPGQPWFGEPLGGKTILLRAEQGLGDTIQFARYLAELAKRGGRVLLAGPGRLASLMAGLQGLSGYVDAAALLPNTDFHAPLMSLPHRLKSVTIPALDSYLQADPDLIIRWRYTLEKLKGIKVGIAWQGNADYELDYARSIPAELLARSIALAGVCPLVLQQGYGREQMDSFTSDYSIIDFGEELDQSEAFTDTAAIMANLDIIVTSDTSIAHLAGALGRPVWVLLPFAPDWRWLLERSDSPWYPSMRLFRQTAPRDWQSALALVKSCLMRWLDMGGNPNDAADAILER